MKKRETTIVCAPISNDVSLMINAAIKARLKKTGILITRADYIRESVIKNLRAAGK